MHLSAPLRASLLKRAFTSLAAIMAVTAIIGVKAMEWERQAAVAETEAARIAAASLAAGS